MVQYKQIPDVDPYYIAGTDGSIWSSRRTRSSSSKTLLFCGKTFYWLKPIVVLVTPNYQKYQIYLRKQRKSKQQSIASVILRTFKGPPTPERPIACHFPDRDTSNNHLENLMWGSRKMNGEHMVLYGQSGQGQRNVSAKITERLVIKLRKEFKHNDARLEDIAKKHNISLTTISNAIRGKSWRHLPDACPQDNRCERGPKLRAKRKKYA